MAGSDAGGGPALRREIGRHGASGRRAAPPRRLGAGSAAALALLALALRLVHIFAMRRSPYFDHPIIDEKTYQIAAKAIASGLGHPDAVYWQPPGYSYFLGAVFAVAGSADLLAPRLVQAALGTIAVLLTAWIGARCFGRSVGLAAGIAAAAYPMLIYYDGELLGVSLTIALQLAALALAVKARESGRAGLAWLGSGLFAGLASVVTATSLLMTIVLAVFARRRPLWVLAGAAIAIAPVTVRNIRHGHEWVLISSNAGVNFYIGNNPRYEQTVAIRPDRQWRELVKEPFQHGIRSQSGASQYYFGRALAWMREDPGAFLRLLGKKARLLLGGDEIMRNQAIYPAREDSPVLRLLLWKIPGLAFPFGVLAPLGLVGLAARYRRAPLLAIHTLAYSLGIVAFFIAERYRTPLVPVLVIFAAEGVRWFAREAGPAARAAALCGAASIYALSNLGQGPMPRRMNADAEFTLAAQLHQEGRLEDARRHYLESLEDRPGYVDSWVNLGVLEATRDRFDEAERAFDRALAIDPNETTALINLAALRERAGRTSEAIELYARAARLDPRDELPRRKIQELRGRPAAP
jgi:tetratricopeptide (TPR) repeat protein